MFVDFFDNLLKKNFISIHNKNIQIFVELTTLAIIAYLQYFSGA